MNGICGKKSKNDKRELIGFAINGFENNEKTVPANGFSNVIALA